MSYIYKVTLIVETDEDPGTILDLAIDALQAPSTSRTVSLEDVKKLDDGLEELAEKLARIMNRSARN